MATSVISIGAIPGFSDQEQEDAYRNLLFTEKQSLIRFGLTLAILLFAVVEPVAREFVPSTIPKLDFFARWFVHLPVVITSLAVLQLSSRYEQLERCLVFCLASLLLTNALLTWLAQAPDRQFYAIASIQIMVFGFLLLGLRFSVALKTVAMCFALPAATAYIADIALYSGDPFHNTYATPLLVFFGLAFAGYSLDVASRATFVAELAREREHRRRLAAESEKRHWLQSGSDYLNHEIKNLLLGITSSMNLLRRRNTDTNLEKYIERADNSAQFMKRLVSEVALSTDLDNALGQLVVDEIDLASLVRVKSIDYQDMYAEQRFTLSAEDPVFVRADPDRLTQAMDKLVDNAVAHSDGHHPITIAVIHSEDTAKVVITNIGDPLVSDGAEIYEPFYSNRERSYDTGLGFGLYIVKRIVEAHRGTVSARKLSDPTGAQFTIELPRLAHTPQS